MNYEYEVLVFSKRPSSNHIECSAQSVIDLHVRGLFIWKSPTPNGNRLGKASVKKYFVVNSETCPANLRSTSELWFIEKRANGISEVERKVNNL